MKALLLAGGYGTRLRPITDTIPKCLVEIKGRPLLSFWLDTVFEQLGCSEVVINTHYLADRVKTFIGSCDYKDKIILIHEPELLGTLNTIRENHSLLKDGEVLVAHADNFCVANWQAFLDCFRGRKSDHHMTMMTFETDNPASCGMVETGQDSQIIRYVEKPQSPWQGNKANGAVFLLDRIALDSIAVSPQNSSDLCGDFIPSYISHINCYHNELIHIDIGTVEAYERAQRTELQTIQKI